MPGTFLPSWARAVLVAVLFAFLLYRGLIPAFTHIDTDFPNYYTAGKIAASGEGITRLYDDVWFQEQITASGIEAQGKFSPFPPPTALLFIPFAVLSPLAALQVMTILNLALFAGSGIVMARILATTRSEAFILLLLGGIGLVNCFRFGQLYLAVSFTIILGYYLHLRGKPVLAGLVIGFFIPIKYFPILFLLFFALRKEWRVCLGAMGMATLITLVSIIVLGREIHELFLGNVLSAHLRSELTLQDPFASTFQSFDSLLRRLFVHDGVLNPRPVVDLPGVYLALKVAITGTIAVVSVFLARRLTRMHGTEFHEAAFALLGISGLLIAPATATYHFILLWLPVGLLLRFFHGQGARAGFRLTLACFTAIGFIPYSVFRQFDGHGALSILAYPRLAILTGLFVIVTYVLSKGADHRSLRFPPGGVQ